MGWDGRLLVIGFVAGIPEVATNHVLLKSYSIVGVHWGASLGRRPESLGEQMTTLLEMATTGAVDPPLYPPYAFEDAATAPPGPGESADLRQGRRDPLTVIG